MIDPTLWYKLLSCKRMHCINLQKSLIDSYEFNEKNAFRNADCVVQCSSHR